MAAISIVYTAQNKEPFVSKMYKCLLMFSVRDACHQLHLISFILLELARSCMLQYGNIRSKKNVADLNFGIRPDLTVAKCHLLLGLLRICFVVVAILFSFCLAKLECGFDMTKFLIIATCAVVSLERFFTRMCDGEVAQTRSRSTVQAKDATIA